MLGNRTARWKRGGAFVGKVPFGYTWNKERKRVEVNPQEAETYRRIVAMYVNEGMSYLDVALRLKREGVKCKKSFFSQVSVSYILKNPAYYGNYIVNRHEYDGNRRTGKMKPGDEHITIEIPALISKTEWDKIQAKRAFNTQKSKRISQARDHWLRDLLVCEEWAGRSSPTPLAGSEKTAQPHVITPASTTRSPPSGLRITTGGGAGSPLSRPRKLKA